MGPGPPNDKVSSMYLGYYRNAVREVGWLVGLPRSTYMYLWFPWLPTEPDPRRNRSSCRVGMKKTKPLWLSSMHAHISSKTASVLVGTEACSGPSL